MSSILNKIINDNKNNLILCISTCDICFEEDINIIKTRCGCTVHYCFNCINKMNNICCVCKNLLDDVYTYNNKNSDILMNSFALNPYNYQPSGTFRSFSRLDDVVLNFSEESFNTVGVIEANEQQE